jgi:hypothetical protein
MSHATPPQLAGRIARQISLLDALIEIGTHRQKSLQREIQHPCHHPHPIDILANASCATNWSRLVGDLRPAATQVKEIDTGACVPESTGRFSTVANVPSHSFSRNMNPLVRSEWIVGSQ